MKEKVAVESSARNRKESRTLAVHSGLRAGYSCPQGWWKYREGKEKMCCHWVWHPGYGYKVDCTT